MVTRRNYQIERRQEHLKRPGFQLIELQLAPDQEIPWHYHTAIQDTFYVLEGQVQLFLREPEESVRLAPGETFTVRRGRPHRVTNAGDVSAVFLNLQGIGAYDWNAAGAAEG
jgi:quercetin dioxygenase-like cupin family protein